MKYNILTDKTRVFKFNRKCSNIIFFARLASCPESMLCSSEPIWRELLYAGYICVFA